MDIIKGSDLMLFVKNTSGVVKSLAFATSHSFSISSETSDISTKDHGFWGAKEVTRITWSITTDNLYTVSTFNELYDRMISRQPIEVYFCLKTPAQRQGTPATVNLPGDTYDTWTPTTTTGEEGYYGRVYITSLDATAAAGDNATFSATFDGIGAITKGLYGSVESAVGGNSNITIGSGSSAQSYSPANRGADAETDYDSSKQYYIYSNGEMIPVDFGSDSTAAAEKFADSKQIYYEETADNA